MIEKEKAKIRAEIIMSLTKGYKPEYLDKIIKVKELNKTPKNYGKSLNRRKW